MEYIKRAIEDVFLSRMSASKSIAVTGASQVGKSTFIVHLLPQMKRINMKNPVLLEAAQGDPLSFIEGFGRPLFINEVQECPSLLNCAKVILDDTTGTGHYVFSGGQKWSLLSGLSDSLAGMVSILELSTLSMREINHISFNQHFIPTNKYIESREKEIKPYDNLWDRIQKGFYPELFDKNSRTFDDFYQSYIATYIERDVYRITKIKDYQTFYRFLVSVAARTGNVLDYSNIANDVGVDATTVKSWIGILCKTDIIYLLQPYFNSHLNRAIKSPKIYFRDTGLAAFLTSWLTPETLANGAMNGAFFETFVVNEIIKSYTNVGKDYSKYIYYYRGKDKVKKGKDISSEVEIDLIIEENGTLYPIEIKKTGKPTISMSNAFDVLDKDENKVRGNGAIICTCKDKLKLKENLYALPVEYI